MNYKYYNNPCLVNRSARLFVPQTARMEKVFIFDVVSKIYVATDSSPVDIQMYEMQSTYSTFKSWPLQINIYCLVRYEMCCDMVDVMLDVSSIYGYPTENDSNGAVGEKITVLSPACSVPLSNLKCT